MDPEFGFMPSFPRVRTWPYKTSAALLASPEWRGICEQPEWYPKGLKSHFLLMFPQMMAAGGGVSVAFSPGYHHIHTVYEDRYMRCMYDPRDFEMLANEVVRRTDVDPGWADLYEQAFLDATQTVIRLTDAIFFEGTKPQSKDLIEQFTEVIDAAVIAQSYGYLTEIFTLTKKEYWVTKRLKELAPACTEEERAILMLPTRPSFLQEYDRVIHEARTQEDFLAVWKRFFWIKGSYETLPDFTVDDVKKEAALPVHTLFDRSIIEKKNATFCRVAEPKKLAEFVHVIEMCVALQDERKSNVLRLNYALYVLIQSLHKHYPAWSVEELLSFSPSEILELVEGGLHVDQRQRIAACNHASVWVGTPDWYAITTDEQAVKTIRHLLEEKSSGAVQGYVAFAGRVQGKARIILSEEDFDRMEEGDVLITSMTRPEFLPVMKRAAAFVTNEGGITCHAAIVARELQKPCIIGTRIATTTFRDGELLEVDGVAGTVTRVT